uniref:CCHC-type domain-containing protein n=1 Tax=Brassica oleracea var. oleracea TaxID=109376 RepID=A0A0D3CIC1_BRAOL
MEATVTFEGDMFKLTTENFSYWKPMMEDHLYCKDLHEPIIMKDKPEGKDDKAWEILNRKSVAIIRKYVDRSLFEHKTPRNKTFLVRRLVKLEYKDDQSMMEHLNNFKGIVNQLNKVDMKVEDKMQALLLLSSLLESWVTLVVTLSNSASEGKLTMDTVTDILLNEEVHRKERVSSSYSEANIVDRRGREETRGHNRSRGRDQSLGRSKSCPRVTCYYCGKPGHMKSECRFFKKDKQACNIKPDRFNLTKKQEDKTTTIVEDQSEELYLSLENVILDGSLILVLLFTSPLMEASLQPTKVVALVMFKWEIKEEQDLWKGGCYSYIKHMK